MKAPYDLKIFLYDVRYAWVPNSTQDRVESKDSGHVSYEEDPKDQRSIQREEKKGGTKQRTKNANTDVRYDIMAWAGLRTLSVGRRMRHLPSSSAHHTHLEQSRQTTTNEKQQRRTHTLVGNDLSSNNKSHRLLIRGTLISDVLRGYKRRWEAGGGRDRPIPSRSQGAHRGARVVML